MLHVDLSNNFICENQKDIVESKIKNSVVFEKKESFNNLNSFPLRTTESITNKNLQEISIKNLNTPLGHS